ncbi:MAG: hypothetical protein MJZ81_07295 [Bacteroidales bacterium]|nr:hypothetical protein [Bacteroidales bacterium]
MKILNMNGSANITFNVVNENGDGLVFRVHSFRGVWYVSMFLEMPDEEDRLIVASQPVIPNVAFATFDIRRDYGAFVCTPVSSGDQEYPCYQNQENYVFAYLEPSEAV